ncbi:MAG: hypothetical protein ACI8W8_001980 [Rhodothermales bacterium]|jgi:hypothetical protein
MMRRRFSLIEVLTVIAIGFVAVTAMITVCHDAMLFVRRANQGTWASQQTVLFREAWRQWVAETSATDWESDGSRFGAGSQEAKTDGELLVLASPGRTRQLALPKGATVRFAREESLGMQPVAVMEISWPRYGTKTGKRESIRIVSAESAP